MTREEVIRELKIQFVGEYDRQREAKDMAIKALEQESVIDEIRAEIEQEYKVESEHPYGEGLRRALKIIDKYKGESEEV
jgi:mannitol/fructose-specific phosphotransferase system IIA component (Ntr-type)